MAGKNNAMAMQVATALFRLQTDAEGLLVLSALDATTCADAASVYVTASECSFAGLSRELAA